MAKVYLFKNKEKRVLYGHPWIFRSDIEKVEGSYECGDIVDVHSYKGKFLARGYYNPKSQIAVRILTLQQEEINADFFYKRIANAWQYRKLVADANSCRVVFAESDFLPALIVDKFSEYLVIQTLALGIDRYKYLLVEILDEIIKPRGIYERNDVPVRELEGLDQRKGYLKGHFDTNILMIENGIKFMVDIENGQKTGFFLDQKENRAAIKPFVKNAKVLDCFSHTGSFALHAAHYGASSVLGIDISEHAANCAAKNAQLNNYENICRFETANTFDVLRKYYEEKNIFDVIILDPPAFTKSRETVDGAIRGYKEINLRAMKIIKPGGFLITCSCSHHIDSEMFMDIIYNAAIDARKNARVIECRSQAKDHPVLLASEETEYLKCIILQIC